MPGTTPAVKAFVVPFLFDTGIRNGIAIPTILVIEVEGVELRGWQIDIHGNARDSFTIRFDPIDGTIDRDCDRRVVDDSKPQRQRL